jgi:hypothetical protein
MLNLRPEAGPIIISVQLFILSYIVSRQAIKQMTILGISFFVDEFKILAVKTAVGIFTGLIFFFVPVEIVSLTSTVINAIIIVNVADFDCNNFVSKVTMDRVSQEKPIGFLETFSEKITKVFIKGTEDLELYVPIYNDNSFCFSEYKQVEVKKHDSTDYSEKAVPYINRYGDRRGHITNKKVERFEL